MPLNVSDAYSAQFSQFVKFAEDQTHATTSKAIARIDQSGGTLATRTISAATDDKVYAIRRSASAKTANDSTRKIFKKAVADMLGGESRIPESVRKAMEMKDYGVGKPLTARRIMAVKTAIDSYHEFGAVDVFANRAFADRATQLGYTAAELPKISRAVNLLLFATPGLTVDQAVDQVMTPGSKANRLMGYGGRFMETPHAFAQGLKLIDDFATWFSDLASQTKIGGHRNSPTAINTRCNLGNSPEGLECFVFEELASNRSLSLSGSPEDVFGMNNPATRFFIRDLARSNAFSFLQMSDEKRSVFFRCTELLLPQANSRKEALGIARASDLVVARVFCHFDELEKLLSKGQLSLETLWNTCFTDIARTVPDKPAIVIGDFDIAFVGQKEAYAEKMSGRPLNDPHNTLGSSIMTTIAAYTDQGYTLDEASGFYERRETPPVSSLRVNCSTSLGNILNPSSGLQNVSDDFLRADGYHMANDPKRTQLVQNPRFIVNIPGANPLEFHPKQVADRKHNDKINELKGLVESLCRTAHPRQLNVVYFSMGQGALIQLRSGFPAHGIISNEHSPVTFTLSRDDATGAVTIRYDSPPGCPITFNWTTTVDIEGRATSTPIQVIDQPTP